MAEQGDKHGEVGGHDRDEGLPTGPGSGLLGAGDGILGD